MKTKQFILLAPPGVKGSEHTAILAERWQMPRIDLDELWQDAIAAGSSLGRQVLPYFGSGKPAPDDLVTKLVQRRLEQPDAMLKGWILGGFPQTLAQAQGLGEWWSAMGQAAPTVVYLKAMTGILLNRLAADPSQTEPAPALRRRVEQFQTDVEPLLTYYQQQDQLKTINANLPFKEVSATLGRLNQENAGAAPLIQDEAELDTLIYGQSRLVVDCMATWCGSCKQVTPSIDKLAAEYRDRVNVTKIDFDANRQISKRFGLQGIPAVMFFKDGQLLETLTGVKSYTEYDTAIGNLLH
ncbi:MAG: nucleoside monophosphate kinase [Leptolyngbyaceae cyanobacterium]